MTDCTEKDRATEVRQIQEQAFNEKLNKIGMSCVISADGSAKLYDDMAGHELVGVVPLGIGSLIKL